MAKRNECPNCQFSLVDAATGACKVCDFIQNKQRTRPCTACGKANCQYFCDTCGNGYHRRCAEKNKVRISPLDDDNEVSVVCPSCEKDDGGAEVTCGGCRKEFTNEDAGLQVGQLVLVEFEMVLYNAVVMEVNEPETSVKIHFVKWSKSFDGWYKMDDERVNESLACDGCNRWFHINCLPEVKSTGRYKAASYAMLKSFKEPSSPSTSSSTTKELDTKTDKKKERPSGPVDPPPAASRVAKSPRLRGAAKSIPPPPPPTEMETQVARTSSPKRKAPTGSQTTVPPPDTPAAPVASSLPPPSVATATTALIHPRHPHASLMSAKPSANNSKLILLSTLLNSPHYDKHNNQENYPPLLHLQGRNRLDILQDVVSQSITSSAPPPPPPPASPPPPLPPGPAPPAVSLRPAASETGLDFDMHFSLREEMYRLLCGFEERGHVLRDTAT
ncbi:hypothetical protein DYB25_003692, partial [Aphanomyces astaci]